MLDDKPVPIGDRAHEIDAVNPAATFARVPDYQVMRGESGGQPQIARLLAAVARYKWLLLGFAIMGAMAGFVLRRFSAPVYRAEVTLWIPTSNDRDAASTGPIRSAR